MATLSQSKPITGEQTLITSDNGVLSLTNYRVKYDASEGGTSKFVSITLEAVSSCGLITRSNPILLLFAAITVIAALLQTDQGIRFGLFFASVAFVVVYFLSRSAVIAINSNGGEGIAAPAQGMSRENILVFLEAVTDAKLKFIGKVDGNGQEANGTVGVFRYRTSRARP